MRKLDKRKFYVQASIYMLGIVAAYALFSLVRIGFESLLIKLGVESEALQYLLIIAIVVILFLLLGLGFKKTMRTIVGK